MKITKEQLKEIIKEELSMALSEAYRDDVVFNPYTGPEVSVKKRVLDNLEGARRRALNTEDPEAAKKREDNALDLIKQGKYEDMEEFKDSVGYPTYEKYNPLIRALKNDKIKPEDLKEIPELTDKDVEDAKAGMEQREKKRRMDAAARKARLRST